MYFTLIENTHMYTNTLTLHIYVCHPYLYEHLEVPADLETDEVTTCASQSTGMSPTTEKIMSVKS